MDASLRRLATVALVGATLLVAACDAIRPSPVHVADRPLHEAPVIPEPLRPAPDFADVFPAPARAARMGAELCVREGGEACRIAPGRYQSTRFAVDVAFSVQGNGWTNSANEFDAVAVEKDDQSFSLFSGAPKIWYWPPPDGKWNLEEWRDWLRAHQEGLIVGAVVDRPAIDGRPARGFDVENAGDRDQLVLSKGSFVSHWSEATYTLAPGRSVRLTFVDVDGSHVVAALEAPATSFKVDLKTLAPMVDSIAFEEGITGVLSGAEPCARWPDTECTMGPGRYHSKAFGVAFDIPDGTWTNTVNWPNVLAMTDENRSITFMSGPPGHCWWPRFCTGGWGGYRDPYLKTPGAIRRHLADTYGIEVSDSVRRTALDGRTARTFDVASLRDDGGWANEVLTIESGAYWMDQGNSARLFFLDIDDEMVVVLLEAPTASLGAYVSDMQPLLDSIRFEDYR